MRQAARTSAAKSKQLAQPATNRPTRRSTRGAPKKEETPDVSDGDAEVKQEVISPEKQTPPKRTRKRETSPTKASLAAHKKPKTENTTSPPSAKPSPSKKSSAADLQAAKLKKYAQFSNVSPYPNYTRPTAAECQKAHSILESIHGPRKRPSQVTASKVTAGCGDSPSVLDALVRTILSQNTSGRNSTAAKLSLDKVYGASDNWEAIMDGGEEKLVEAIRCGGLAVVKSRVIRNILSQVKEKYGVYSLDHLHDVPTEEAFTTMLSFQGVGPKTASCVVLFCLERESFAVDTHVFRISKLLGWVPKEADREKAQAHLEIKVPPEDKYALHILMVTHGKVCGECKANKEVGAKCKLRDAFRGKGIKDEDMEEDVKEEDGVEDEE